MIILTEDNGEQYIIEAFNRAQLLDMLVKNTVVVSFRKRSNSRQRLMYCTRDLKRIPRQKHPSGQGMPYDPVSKGLIPVFDLIKKDWRSFAVDNVSDAQTRTLGWLTRFLQRKKYTMDESAQFKDAIVLEAYHVEKERVGFKEFNEMASGPVGDGVESNTSLEGFEQLRKLYVARVFRHLSNYKLEKYGKIGNLTCFCLGNEWKKYFWATKLSDPIDSLDNEESIVFISTLFNSEEEVEEWNNGFETYVIDQPHIHPDYMRKGLGSQFYALIAHNVNILADNVQSKQARLLWNSLVKSNRCKVFMYDTDTEEFEDITGAEQTFQHYMATGGDNIRFIATTRDPI